MSLKLEEKTWGISIETNTVIEYDNYVDGFSPITDNNFTFDTVRVFISVNKKTGTIDILSCPWKNGETYSDYELLPDNLIKGISNLVEQTNHYKNLFLMVKFTDLSTIDFTKPSYH